jgi:hypothetical protein
MGRFTIGTDHALSWEPRAGLGGDSPTKKDFSMLRTRSEIFVVVIRGEIIWQLRSPSALARRLRKVSLVSGSLAAKRTYKQREDRI